MRRQPTGYDDVIRDPYIDAIQVINDLNFRGSRTLPTPPEPPDAPAPFLDVDGDGVTSPLDALIVINWLNEDLVGGEGEGLLIQPLSDLQEAIDELAELLFEER